MIKEQNYARTRFLRSRYFFHSYFYPNLTAQQKLSGALFNKRTQTVSSGNLHVQTVRHVISFGPSIDFLGVFRELGKKNDLKLQSFRPVSVPNFVLTKQARVCVERGLRMLLLIVYLYVKLGACTRWLTLKHLTQNVEYIKYVLFGTAFLNATRRRAVASIITHDDSTRSVPATYFYQFTNLYAAQDFFQDRGDVLLYCIHYTLTIARRPIILYTNRFGARVAVVYRTQPTLGHAHL